MHLYKIGKFAVALRYCRQVPGPTATLILYCDAATGPVSLLLPWYHRAPCAGNGRRYSTRHYSASSVGVSGVCVLLGSPYVVLSYRIPPLANVFVSLVVIMGKVTHGIRNNHNSQIHLCCTFILNYIDRKNSFRIQFGHDVNNRF